MGGGGGGREDGGDGHEGDRYAEDDAGGAPVCAPEEARDGPRDQRRHPLRLHRRLHRITGVRPEEPGQRNGVEELRSMARERRAAGLWLLYLWLLLQVRNTVSLTRRSREAHATEMIISPPATTVVLILLTRRGVPPAHAKREQEGGTAPCSAATLTSWKTRTTVPPRRRRRREEAGDETPPKELERGEKNLEGRGASSRTCERTPRRP